MNRSENQIFKELSRICTSKGYAHVIAFFCFRDNTIRYSEELTGEDLSQFFSSERLLRNEISALTGLMVKGAIDYSLPDPTEIQKMIDDTESILHELHLAIAKPFSKELEKKISTGSTDNPFKKGSLMREPILYSGESAHLFQYRDFAPLKYRKDNRWLKKNMGFGIKEAHKIVSTIFEIQNRKITEGLNQIRENPPESWTYLPMFKFTIDEVIKKTGYSSKVVLRVLNKFTFSEESKNESFKNISDFNKISATPILKVEKKEYLLFQPYSLFEALYESPFYWMLYDENYKDTSSKNRGDFTEEFTKECLSKVFGDNRVFKSVEIIDSKKKNVGEIDVLAIYGDRAIVVQAKSKKLTIEARKGNETNLNSDFKKAIQESYNQGYDCSKFLQNADYQLQVDDKILEINRDLKEIYIFCVVSDHFPALTTLAFHNLKFEKSEKIPSPFVMDIFHLDVMTEILNSPLYFMSYIKRRVDYAEKIHVTNEGVILAYHLKNNLWIEGKTNLMHITDDWSAELDVAMLARRESLPGKKIPDGILSKYRDTHFENLINQLSRNYHPAAIELGMFLLQLGEGTVMKMNEWLEMIKIRCLKDGLNHDFSIAAGNSGISVHCNKEKLNQFVPRLNAHVLGRKYLTKSDQWFGVCVAPDELKFKYVIEFNEPWHQDKKMDDFVSSLPFKNDDGYKI